MVATDDLIDGIAPTVTGNITDAEGLHADVTGVSLSNGTFGPAGLTGDPGPNPEVTIIHDGVTVDFALPYAYGYKITDIHTYSGWRDAGRVKQDYEILYTTTGNPTFTSLATVNAGYAGGSPSSLEVLVSDIDLTNVTATRFSFPTTQNTYVGYRELDVFGMVIPEPNTLLVWSLLAGLGAALIRRRRR